MSKQHIAVLGAGSIGCYLGGLLAGAGLPVTFIGRERYRDAVAEHGLTLTHFERDPLVLSAQTIDFAVSAQALGGADIIALCTKSQDTERAAQQILEHAKADVTVISFQNGIGNAQVLENILPSAKIVPAIVPFNVTPTAPGTFHCGTAGELILGSAVEPVMTGLVQSGQAVRVSENIEGDQWAKMIVNLNNGLNTLAGGTLMAGLTQKSYRLALAAVVEEALRVAQAAGVEVGTFNGRAPSALVKTLRLPNWAYKIIMQKIVKIDATARSSMLDDLDASRACEVDYLQGEIVRQAAAAGTTAPRNAAVMEAVRLAFAAGASPKMSGADILNLVK